MTIERKNIRKKIVEVLTGATSAGDNVVASRTTKPFIEQLPAISVYTLADSVAQELTQTPRVMHRTIELVIDAHIADPNDPTDALDEIGEAIEQALSADETLGGLAEDLKLTDCQINLEGEANAILGAIRLTFEVTYLSAHPKETATTEFSELDAVWTDMAQDRIFLGEA